MAELGAAAVHAQLLPVAKLSAPVRPRPLWLCLQFPDLPLESRPEYDPHDRQAVVANQRGLPVIVSASLAARHAGVRPGMPVHAATVLAGDLRLLPQDLAAEQQRLCFLAERCGQYTPTVSLLQPDALLLELRASLRLFGGLAALLTCLQQELRRYRQRMQWASAVTPLAASLLARAHVAEPDCMTSDVAALQTVLGPLPATLLVSERGDRQKLQRLGVRCLRELWRLPRDGLARRFGSELVTQLDQLLGKAPDPRAVFAPAKRFSAELALEFPSRDAAVVLVHARTLLQQLLDFLRRHDLAAGRIHLRLQPQQGTAQTVAIGSRCPGRELEHWWRLLQQVLPQQRLPMPVQQLCLYSNDLHAFAAQTINWLQPRTARQTWSKVLDTLETRLQRPSRFFSVRADHRPEQAWCLTAAPDKQAPLHPAAISRPLWLLPQPQLLHRQPQLLNGPERIEAGWWDGEDCCRDYYVAAGEGGERLWVYRDLKQPAWYLHGLFA